MNPPSLDVASAPETPPVPPGDGELEFLWLELTNRCNLRCVHCYSDSDPSSGHRDLLTTADYEDVLRQAADLGCRRVQFIGGEPQLHRDFLALVDRARELEFEFIEIFSNLTFLSEDTLRYAADHGIRFATSVYSDEPSGHDAITTVRSSHARTARNLERLVSHGVETRAGLIVIDQDRATVERTGRWLHQLGVRNVRISEVREFGRGEDLLGRDAQMSGLCGHCWQGKLCITPDGSALACVMSREWPVGNVLDTALVEIIGSAELHDVRRTVYETVWLPRVTPTACGPHHCPQSCEPDYHVCNPDDTHCPQSCSPPIITRCEPDPT
jgi:MoaA/NifB/PqqE/SkfB family radical SAM enzyme